MVLLKRTRMLEQRVEQFLDLINQSALTFQEGVSNYLNQEHEEFERHLQAIRDLENSADRLRREIESHLYTYTLIPESRGDVLALLETTDNVTDRAKDTLLEIFIEIPDIPDKYKEEFMRLTRYVVQAVEEMVKATRAFFRDVKTVQNHLHKVHFYEKEADNVSESLKKKIFRDENITRLSHKIHLRYFAYHIDIIADYAEDVADRLAIYAIKRSI